MNSTAGSPTSSAPETLDRLLLAAHAADDRVGLSVLYGRAADLAERDGAVDRACFFLTQAFVFALDAGLDTAPALEARLRAYGRA